MGIILSPDEAGKRTEALWKEFFIRCGYRAFSYHDFNRKLVGIELEGNERGTDLVIQQRCCKRYTWIIQVKTGMCCAATWLDEQLGQVKKKPQQHRAVIPVIIGEPPTEFGKAAAEKVIFKIEADFYWHRTLQVRPTPMGNPSYYKLKEVAGSLIELGAYLVPPFDWSYQLLKRKNLLPNP